ncbi:replication-relaxation family protein [Dactylosporangium aurantiacum]|uniref:Replication-relaxation family protein n=1 Tax=Dactylosporangium aurantiacum TaxID=35754 RepID=A0A9Q9IK68_9ACTN|nr:replication-relaxation family protein [Dactylosporangium aurantiacum]MDG6100512.1 replication-relaxation family protein [Dactylosporangium aurantiacum]UWZ55387.1 replication-relaxation family protein [Dactylosporangium aurantiacum]
MTDPVLRVQSHLTDRDHTLLGWLADHGVLTSFQIADALFPSLDFAQERLRTLTRIGVLDRFRPQKPDGGSYPYHYVLAQLGVEVVAAQRGDDLPRRDQARRRRWHLTNRANLPHLLGTNGFFTDLAGHARTHPHTALVRWWPAARCQNMGAFAQDGDDINVRTYTPTSRPDGHGVWVDGARSVPFFLEFDTGTERPLTRLVDKLDGYFDLARVTRRVWPVLFWLPSQARERHLHQHLSQAGVRYPVATAVHRAAGGGHPAGPVWWLHRHPGAPRRLADLIPPTHADTT